MRVGEISWVLTLRSNCGPHGKLFWNQTGYPPSQMTGHFKCKTHDLIATWQEGVNTPVPDSVATFWRGEEDKLSKFVSEFWKSWKLPLVFLIEVFSTTLNYQLFNCSWVSGIQHRLQQEGCNEADISSSTWFVPYRPRLDSSHRKKMIYRHQEEQLLIGVLQGLRNLMFLWGAIQFLPVSLYGQRLATLVFACKKTS